MSNKLIILCLLQALLKVSFPNPGDTILVGCAANFRLPIEKIRDRFRQSNQNSKIKLVFGSSGQLAAQILHGAPFDIFLAADEKRPLSVHKAGLSASEVIPYAIGNLVLFSPKPRPLQNIADALSGPGVHWIAIANPDLAPYGQASLEVIRNLGIFEPMKSKLVFSENIMQAAQFSLTATDLGFLSKSLLELDALRSFDREGTHWMGIDPDLHSPIVQGLLLLKKGAEKRLAKSFFRFIQSKDSSQILLDSGYSIPTPNLFQSESP